MANFTIAYGLTMSNEGDYANNKLDTGGETYKGVSRNSNPHWEGWKIIDGIKHQNQNTQFINKQASSNTKLQLLVQELYKKSYWEPNRLSLVISQDVANELFDTGVNMGVVVAGKMFQRALNVCGNSLIVDGVIGNKTIEAANKCDSKLVYKILNVLQGERYVAITEANHSQKVFVKSWFSRVDIIK